MKPYYSYQGEFYVYANTYTDVHGYRCKIQELSTKRNRKTGIFSIDDWSLPSQL